jgi:hypothetical protein
MGRRSLPNDTLTDTTFVVPIYLRKLLDVLEASPLIVAGWTVTVAHDATCPMSTNASAECCCDPDVTFAERRAVWHPWN